MAELVFVLGSLVFWILAVQQLFRCDQKIKELKELVLRDKD